MRQRRAALVGEAYIVGAPPNCQQRFSNFFELFATVRSELCGTLRQPLFHGLSYMGACGRLNNNCGRDVDAGRLETAAGFEGFGAFRAKAALCQCNLLLAVARQNPDATKPLRIAGRVPGRPDRSRTWANGHNRAVLPPQSGRMSCTPERGAIRSTRTVLFLKSNRGLRVHQPASLTSLAVTGKCHGGKKRRQVAAPRGRAAVLNARNGSNHSQPRQRAAADCRWAQRPAGSARGFGALAFRHLPDRRHIERADGRGFVCRPRRPRAVGRAAGDRRTHRPRRYRRFRRKRKDDAAFAAAADRQGQGPPSHGSVDGHQGRRPRRDQDDALRPDQDGAGRRPQDDAQLSRPSTRLRSLPKMAPRRSHRARPARSTASRSRAR